MKEVIARRKGGLLLLYGICCVLGVVVLISALKFAQGANQNTQSANGVKAQDAKSLLLLIMGIFVIVVSLYICVKYLCTPREIITYDGNKLYIGKYQYSPSQITNVTYRCARSKGWHYRWGKITVHLGVEKHTFNFVADVEETHNRLIMFIRQTSQSAS